MKKWRILCSHQSSPEWSMIKFRAYIHRHVFRPSQDGSMLLGSLRREELMSRKCWKHQVGAELCQDASAVVKQQKIFCSHQCSPECSMNKVRAYLYRHVFRPSQNSSVWLRLTRREQLMSPDPSKHQMLSIAKMLVVLWMNEIHSVLISVLESGQWLNSERMCTDTCFVLSRTHRCGFV